MLDSSLSPIGRISIACLVLVGCVLELSAQPPTVTIALSAERKVIIAGEPLVLSITLTNSSAKEVAWQTDTRAIRRTTVGPNDLKIVSLSAPKSGDAAVFYRKVGPAERDTIVLVAKETAQIGQPGEYRITVEYAPLSVSAGLDFTVQPYDSSSLRTRALEVLEPAGNWRSSESAKNLDILEALDPAVAKPFLCDVMRRNSESYSVAIRLEEIGDAESVSCLIDVLGGSRGLQREVIISSLKRLIVKTPDETLRDRMKRSLESN
jgi:hypothetical protein